MIFSSHINPLTEEETYQIFINKEDDVYAFEIAECFKKQFPKKLAVLSFSREKIICEFGIILIGLNLGKLK